MLVNIRLSSYIRYPKGTVAAFGPELGVGKGSRPDLSYVPGIWRYEAIVISDEPAAQVDRLRYVLANGVKEVAGLIEEIEADAAAERKRTGREPLGAAAILRQHPHSWPVRCQSGASRATRWVLKNFQE